jgi:hypothetical protein
MKARLTGRAGIGSCFFLKKELKTKSYLQH